MPAYPLSLFGTLAHVGPMARTVRDAAMLLDVIARPDDRDWYALPYAPDGLRCRISTGRSAASASPSRPGSAGPSRSTRRWPPW